MASQCQGTNYIGSRCMNPAPDGDYCYAHKMSSRDRRLGALPLGELHDEGVCARCGALGKVDPDIADDWPEPLMRTVLVSTHAVAMVCKDTHGCLRRRTNKRKGRL